MEDIEKKINVKFSDPDLLKQAFTHRSYLNENRGLGLEHNERLEFLGDAVLELAVTKFLYDKFPEKPEGELTLYRAALVNTNSLSEVSSTLGLNDHLLLSKGEEADTGRARHFILADVFEAVIGAIYLDQGYDAAQKFIEANLFEKIDDVIAKKAWIDSKSLFQEKAQETMGETPMYKTLSEEGPDHDKKFIVAVYVGKEEMGQGEGKSKQDAEQEAAENALKAKGWR